MPVLDDHARSGHRPWLTSYPNGLDWSAEISVEPMTAALDRAVARSAARPCIDFLGRTYSYGEVADLVAHAATGLQALGVEKGTRVGLLLPNCPTYVIAYTRC
jgi:long-chain acyl-CoA synthetase